MIEDGLFEITIVTRDQIQEARWVIYIVSYVIFHDLKTLEETIAYYQVHWSLLDIDNRTYAKQVPHLAEEKITSTRFGKMGKGRCSKQQRGTRFLMTRPWI